MSIIALNHLSTGCLIRTDHFPVVFGIELGREAGGIDQVTEHDGELTAFRFGGMRGSGWRCDVCGLGLWRDLRLRWWCGDGCRWRSRFPNPNKPSASLIDNLRRGEQDFVFQVFEIVVIDVKASFQRTIGHTSLTFEQFEYLGEDFIEGHKCPSAAWVSPHPVSA